MNREYTPAEIRSFKERSSKQRWRRQIRGKAPDCPSCGEINALEQHPDGYKCAYCNNIFTSAGVQL